MSFVYNGLTYTPLTANTVTLTSGTSATGNLIIPSTVTNSGITYTVVELTPSCCQANNNITSVTIPSTVVTIGYSSFAYCLSLSTVNFDTPSSLTTIGDGAFYNVNNITTLTIPASVTSIGIGSFINSNINQIYFNGPVPSVQSNSFKVHLSGTWTCNYYYTGNISALQANSFFTVFIPFGGPPCFLKDTKILTDKGYQLIQDLKEGDMVKTYKDGYVPIYMIGKKKMYHPAEIERISKQLYIYKKKNIPELFEDLIITGDHSVLVDEFKDEEQREKTKDVLKKIFATDNKYRLPACVDDRSSIYKNEGHYTIYHIALENENYYMNYGIYANGMLVESISKRYLKELSGMNLSKKQH